MTEETLLPLDLSDAIAMIDRQRQRIDELREALETICEIGETRDVKVARKALRGGEVKDE